MTGKRQSIIVIDDEEIIRISCRRILEKDGYDVTCFEDSAAGLANVVEIGEPPHLALIDLKMPKLSGIDLVKIIKEKRPEVMLVIMTGYASIESAVEAVKAGAYDYLPKPFTPDELRIVIGRAIEKMQLDMEASALRAEKERMQKNFITMVSHNLRSPLSAVCQNFDVILKDMLGPVEPRQREVVEKSKARIEALTRMISDWLSLAKIEAGEMVKSFEAADPAGLLEQCVEMVSIEAKTRKVTITLKAAGGLPALSCESRTLMEAFNNVICNAVKYNREGGSVTITARKEGGGVLVETEDTGVGIPANELPFIFDEFYRGRTGKQCQVEGTGLGLAITKKIVEAHSGWIKAESEPGKGSRFSIFLPGAPA